MCFLGFRNSCTITPLAAEPKPLTMLATPPVLLDVVVLPTLELTAPDKDTARAASECWPVLNGPMRKVDQQGA